MFALRMEIQGLDCLNIYKSIHVTSDDKDARGEAAHESDDGERKRKQEDEEAAAASYVMKHRERKQRNSSTDIHNERRGGDRRGGERREGRTEERRVGKEGRSRWSPYHEKKKKKKGRLCEED